MRGQGCGDSWPAHWSGLRWAVARCPPCRGGRHFGCGSKVPDELLGCQKSHDAVSLRVLLQKSVVTFPTPQYMGGSMSTTGGERKAEIKPKLILLQRQPPCPPSTLRFGGSPGQIPGSPSSVTTASSVLSMFLQRDLKRRFPVAAAAAVPREGVKRWDHRLCVEASSSEMKIKVKL